MRYDYRNYDPSDDTLVGDTVKIPKRAKHKVDLRAPTKESGKRNPGVWPEQPAQNLPFTKNATPSVTRPVSSEVLIGARIWIDLPFLNLQHDNSSPIKKPALLTGLYHDQNGTLVAMDIMLPHGHPNDGGKNYSSDINVTEDLMHHFGSKKPHKIIGNTIYTVPNRKLGQGGYFESDRQAVASACTLGGMAAVIASQTEDLIYNQKSRWYILLSAAEKEEMKNWRRTGPFYYNIKPSDLAVNASAAKGELVSKPHIVQPNGEPVCIISTEPVELTRGAYLDQATVTAISAWAQEFSAEQHQQGIWTKFPKASAFPHGWRGYPEKYAEIEAVQRDAGFSAAPR